MDNVIVLATVVVLLLFVVGALWFESFSEKRHPAPWDVSKKAFHEELVAEAAAQGLELHGKESTADITAALAARTRAATVAANRQQQVWTP